ncbi:unnamed protein product [Ilex paraguariensis]
MEAPEFFIGGYFGHAVGDNQLFDQKTNDNNNQFAVDDLLDFSKEEVMTDGFFDNVTGNSAHSSTVSILDSCNSSVSGGEPPFSGNISCRSFNDPQFSGSELCVPYDDLADLEWLSNFVEDSFSSDDLQNLQLTTVTTTAPTDTASISSTTTTTLELATMPNINSSPIFPSAVVVPGKARSKRSRAAPGNWSSRLLVLSPAKSSSENNTPPIKTASSKKRESAETPGRKCLHCASDKTPQWRTGPLGPKTLCNACGVRYKSGRLVPEYRPAASPTFMSAKHSNSHRKVLELRRQNELQTHHQQQLLTQTSIFGVPVSNGNDYVIHHQSGQEFRHMI